MPVLLTRQIIDEAQPSTRTFDAEVRGLALRVSRQGVKSFVLRYRSSGVRREIAIGSADDLTASQARRHAKAMRDKLAGGIDPLAAKAEKRAAVTAARARKTLREFVEAYKTTVDKKPLTKDSDESLFDKWILPLLGSVPVADIGRQHAQQLHAHVTDAGFKTRANRAHALLSHVITEAARRGLRDAPLPRGIVTKNPETKRERYLSPAESSRLWKALTAMQEPTAKGDPGVHADAAAALKVLMLTGCRKREILNLSWSEVDADASCLRLADSKTGRRVVQLSPAALALLEARRPAEDDPNASRWVFPTADGKGHVADTKRSWEHAIKAAKLPGLRVHDLRHALASQAVAAGLSLVEVGKLLGHRSQQTSSRYAHLSDEGARLASDRVAVRMAAITDAASGLKVAK